MEKIQNGYGSMTDSYGSKYEGEIVNGIPHGNGTMTSIEGVKQEGNFKNGLFHGKFSITFPNGDKGEGNWKDGIYEEDGTFTTVEGKTLKNVRFIDSNEREILSLINNPRTRGVVII
ncbi:MAG: hypothetical protein H8D80_02320 [Proteobacteria bacterium]|nr:hypothetical protein [Pseudomonadota bacterium]